MELQTDVSSTLDEVQSRFGAFGNRRRGDERDHEEWPGATVAPRHHDTQTIRCRALAAGLLGARFQRLEARGELVDRLLLVDGVEGELLDLLEQGDLQIVDAEGPSASVDVGL